MKIAIVTDSTAYLTPEERREWDIYVLPLSVIFGQESYREEQDLTTADFYEKVKNSEVFPTSSQPAVGETIELFRELSHHYDAIIPILLSSGISGTYQTVVTVAEELQDEVLIYPIDSGISCAPQARAVRLAAMMAKDEQYTAKEIVACVQQLVDRTTAYFIVDDLNNLQRGGRLSAGAALVGSMLKIKPILTFEDKKIVALEKIRTQQKAMKRIEQLFEEDTQTTDGDGYELVIIHANAPEAGEVWRAQIQEKYPKLRTSLAYFGPVIGTHLGQGALGCSWDIVIEKNLENIEA